MAERPILTVTLTGACNVLTAGVGGAKRKIAELPRGMLLTSHLMRKVEEAYFTDPPREFPFTEYEVRKLLNIP